MSFIILYSLCLAAIIGTASYVYSRRGSVDEMHGMMAGMTLGYVSGLATATLFVIPTGNFLWGVILGTVVGLIFGVPFGRLGGHLGTNEGIMAGPMGGMMGAMLGQMIRPFDLAIFMPFFSGVVLMTLIGITYAVNCVSCCPPPKKKTTASSLPDSFVWVWGVAVIVLILASVMMTFSLEQPPSGQARIGGSASDGKSTGPGLKIPESLRGIAQDITANAAVDGPLQKAEILIGASRYTPNIIKAKPGIPLQLSLRATPEAGCTREIVFPELKTSRIVSGDKSEVLDLGPLKEGVYAFRCSMDMVHGRIEVKD